MTLQAHGGYLDIDLRGSGSHLGNETIRLKIKKKKKKTLAMVWHGREQERKPLNREVPLVQETGDHSSNEDSGRRWSPRDFDAHPSFISQPGLFGSHRATTLSHLPLHLFV